MIEQQKECLKSSTMKGQFVWWIQILKEINFWPRMGRDCESFQNGILIEAIVDRPQYRFGQNQTLIKILQACCKNRRSS